MISLAILMAIGPQPSITEREPTILFSKWHNFDAHVDTVEIWLKQHWLSGEFSAPDYLIKRTVSYRPELKLKGKSVFWSGAKDCPQALTVLERLNKLQAPVFIVSEISPDDATTGRADGASYRLRAEGRYPFEPGTIDITFGPGTPVATWVDESVRSLSSCWRTERPEGL